MGTATPTSFTDRMIRAAMLKDAVYEEVEADRGATMQAALVVVLGSLAVGIGSGANVGFLGIVAGVIAALASWSLYAWIVYFFGTTILKGSATKAEWGELARTLGFANSPRILLVFVGVPGLGPLVNAIVALWLLATTIVAVRASLDVSTARAVVVAIVALVAQVALTLFLLGLL